MDETRTLNLAKCQSIAEVAEEVEDFIKFWKMTTANVMTNPLWKQYYDAMADAGIQLVQCELVDDPASVLPDGVFIFPVLKLGFSGSKEFLEDVVGWYAPEYYESIYGTGDTQFDFNSLRYTSDLEFSQIQEAFKQLYHLYYVTSEEDKLKKMWAHLDSLAAIALRKYGISKIQSLLLPYMWHDYSAKLVISDKRKPKSTATRKRRRR